MLLPPKSQRSRAGMPSMRKPASREITSDSASSVWHWSLFLSHPTHENKCSTSEDTYKNPPPPSRSGFRVFEISSKVWVLEQTQSTMLSRITHMTKVSVITRVVNVGNQTSQAFVTSSSPFCDSSCKFVYGPKNVRSTNSCQLQAFQDNLGSYFWRFSNWFHFLSLEMRVIQAKVWDFVQLLCLFVCQLTISFNALFRVTFHIIRSRDCFCVRFSPTLVIFQLPQQKVLIRTFLCSPSQYFRSIRIHVGWVHPKHTWSRNEAGSTRSTSFIHFFHTGATLCFFPAVLMTYTSDKNNPCFFGVSLCLDILTWKLSAILEGLSIFYLSVSWYCIGCLSATT